MKDYAELDRINSRLDSNVAEWFFAVGNWIQAKLNSGEYKTIKGAGLDCASHCEKMGRAVSTATIYAAHKAATAFPNTIKDMLISYACPLGLLQQYAYCDLREVEVCVDRIGRGPNTWLDYTRKKQRNTGPKLKWGTPKHDTEFTQPEAKPKLGASGAGRVTESQLNPPVQADVEDPESVRLALLNIMSRRGKAILEDWNVAADRYNKGKNPEYRLPLLKTS